MTASVHNQGHPWGRTLPYPTITMPHNSSESYIDQHIPMLRRVSLQPRPTSTTHLQRDIRNGSISDAHPAYQRAETAQLPVHVSSVSSTDLQLPFVENSLTQHQEYSVMSTEDARRSSSPSTSSTIDSTTRFCLCQNEPHIPRPRNAFILFRQHQHARAVAQNPGLPNPDISKIIGEQWRRLSDKTKGEWKALAEDEKMRHSQQYPEYRYRPRRSVRHSIPASTSDSSSIPTENLTPCHKCGGKLVNAPAPPYPPSSVPITESESMNQGINRLTTGEQQVPIPILPPPPPPAGPHPYEGFHAPSSQPHAMRHEQRSQGLAGINHTATTMHDHTTPKRRRLNGNVPHLAGRGVFPEHYRSNHEPLAIRTAPTQLSPLQISPHNIAPQFPRPNAPYSAYSATPRHEPNLILPPLQTIPGRTRTQSDGRVMQAQKLGVEAMIMSIPVLNKVKILSQVSPSLSTPSPSPVALNSRGAVIAIEGMDMPSVLSMTKSLADQLERDGKFAVRIFGGPVPHTILEQPQKVSADLNETSMSFADCLGIITQWHGISKEVKDYITTSQAVYGSEQICDATRNVASIGTVPSSQELQTPQQETGNVPSTFTFTSSTPKTPITAVSPKTTPMSGVRSEEALRKSSDNHIRSAIDTSIEPVRPKSRIPAAARAQQTATEIQAQVIEETSTEAMRGDDTNTSVGYQPNYHGANQQSEQTLSTSFQTTTTQAQTALPPVPLSQSANLDRPAIRNKTQTPIPIALVPHYQLTTVNALAITMPIKDTYSPHSHWQWLATLWRGCIGPDITIALKSNLDDGDINSADGSQSAVGNFANAIPMTPASGHPHTPLHSHPHAHQHHHPYANPHPHNQSQPQPHMSKPIQPRPGQAAYPNGQSNQVQGQTMGVEVRLSDFKTIIVKTGNSRYGQDRTSTSSPAGKPGTGSGTRAVVSAIAPATASVNNGSGSGLESVPNLKSSTGGGAGGGGGGDMLNSEAWEKAKRRVAFEVEEFLRK